MGFSKAMNLNVYLIVYHDEFKEAVNEIVFVSKYADIQIVIDEFTAVANDVDDRIGEILKVEKIGDSFSSFLHKFDNKNNNEMEKSGD